MALHGSIQVNGQPIAHWSAVRTTALSSVDATHVYECEVVWEGREPHRFTLVHPYDLGATTLAANLLAVAADKAPAPPALALSR